MAPTPLCGSLTSRRSFLTMAWTLTTLLSFFSFGVSVFLGIKITNQYNSLLTDEYAEWYRDEYGREYRNNANWNCRHLNEDGEQGDQQQQQGQDREGCHSNDHMELDEDFFESLATTNSRGLVFAGVYTTVLGIALSLYGSTVVVGFMSAKGEYIPPCFSFRNMSVIEEDEGMNDEDSTVGPRKLWGEKIHRGIFLGSIVIFSNLMLLCAIIFGELQVRGGFQYFQCSLLFDWLRLLMILFESFMKVHDNYNNYDDQRQHNMFSYRIEKISSVFAITCIVLAFVYILVSEG